MRSMASNKLKPATSVSESHCEFECESHTNTHKMDKVSYEPIFADLVRIEATNKLLLTSAMGRAEQ